MLYTIKGISVATPVCKNTSIKCEASIAEVKLLVLLPFSGPRKKKKNAPPVTFILR